MIIIIIIITIIKPVTTTFNPTSMFVNQKVQTLRCTSSVPLVYSVVGSVEGQRTGKQHGKQGVDDDLNINILTLFRK